MKRSYRLKFTEELSLPVCRVLKLFFLMVGEPWPKLHMEQWYCDQSLPKPLRHFKVTLFQDVGLFASQVIFPCFILNHILHLSQQLTPDDEEGLCFWGAAVLSSSFDNFLKSFQANCRPEIGSSTLRLDVFVFGLDGSSLGREPPLDPLFFFLLVLLGLWKKENC